jgi:eukaryotic-like serine/threonine-protein kinase
VPDEAEAERARSDEETVEETAMVGPSSPATGGPADELPVVPAGTYALGPEVARGGIGRIRRALDQRMGRTVAIKELLPAHHRNADTQARFVREALVTGRLEHPSIVPVYEAGRWPSGAPFYAMKMVSGRSLLELIRARPSFDERLALLPHVIAVAEAIAYAHSKRVIHRDIKPANVIVGTFGETVVIDWGLAKDLDAAPATPPAEDDGGAPEHLDGQDGVADASLGSSRSSSSSPGATVVGKVMGTPAYMAPEQARGLAVDERTDVYALGALLYHVLAGCSPFAQDDGTVSMGETQTGGGGGGGGGTRAIVPLERRQAGIPTELLTIVRKAMAREAGERYPGARQLADDLQRFQTGQLVSAHRYSTWALVRRWLRRYRAVLSLGAVALVALAVIGAVSVSRIVRARELADEQRGEAQRRGAEAEARTNELILLQAQAALDTDPTASLAWLKLYPATAPAWDRARSIAVDAQSRGIARHVLRGHQGSIQALAISPDGAIVASGGTDQTLRLTALAAAAPAGAPTILKLSGAVGGLAYTPDGTRLLAIVDRALLAWPLDGPAPAAQQAPITIGTHDAAISNLALSPDGRTVATVSMDKSVRLWDLAGGGEPRVWRGETYASWGVAFTPDGRTLLTGSEERNLRLWNLATGESRTVTNPEQFGPIATSPDGRTVALAGATGVHLWSIAAEPPTYRALPRQSDYVIHLAFSPDGTQLATVNSGGSVRVWDLASSKARELDGHRGHVVNLAYARDGALLATAGDDGTVRVWPVAELGPSGQTLLGLDRATSYPRFAPDGRTVAVGTDGGIALLDLATRRWRVITGARGQIGAVNFLPGGAVVSLGEAGIRRWDIARGAPEPLLAPIDTAPELLLVSPAGDLLVLGPGHDAAIVVDSATGAERCRFAGGGIWSALFTPDGREVLHVDGDRIMLGTLAGCTARELYRHAPGIISLAVAPDGRHLASGVDARVALWDTAASKLTWLTGHAQLVSEVAFSPDGATLASGGVDQTIHLWDVATGTSRRVLTGHEQAIRTLIFVGNTHLASAALDGTVRVWDLASDDVRVFRGQENAIASMTASPDGRWLLSTSRDVTRLWSLTTGGLPADARGPGGLGAWLSSATTATIGPGDVVGTR